jgi:hypothetical protein
MKEVISVDIILENCESISVAADYIGEIYVGEIVEEITRIATNAVCKFKTAGVVVLELLKEFNSRPYYVFGNEDFVSEKKERLFNYRDITALEFIYDDGTSEIYYVDYKAENEEKLGSENINQENFLSSSGSVCIVITANEEVKEMFKEEMTKGINEDEAE